MKILLKYRNWINVTTVIKSIKIKKNKKTNLIKKLKIKLNTISKKQLINKNFVTYIKLNLCYSNKKKFNEINKQIGLRFIFNINYSNIYINILNNLNEQICSYTLGFYKFKRLDKITKKYILLQVLKNLLHKTKKKSYIAVHYRSNNNIYSKLILNFLKNNFLVQVFKFYNNLSHNGCRGKKKRRK